MPVEDLPAKEFVYEKDKKFQYKRTPVESNSTLSRKRNYDNDDDEEVAEIVRNYIEKDEIGRGNFGVVYKVEQSSSGKFWALKEIKCSSKTDVKEAMKEVNMLKGLRHPYILQFEEAFVIYRENERYTCIVTEYCSNGTLNDHLAIETTRKNNHRWMVELASAMKYLHEHQPVIVHRDLKPENIFITAQGCLKVADFGLALHSINQQQFERYSTNVASDRSVCGTKMYLAPEIYDQIYAKEGDIFSLGLIYCTMIERTFVNVGGKCHYAVYFKQENEGKCSIIPVGVHMRYSRNSNHRIDFLFRKANDYEKSLIKLMLQRHPAVRPPASDIYRRCRWMESVDGKSNHYVILKTVVGDVNNIVKDESLRFTLLVIIVFVLCCILLSYLYFGI
ncbi:Serine/threonine-protein kinase PDIK1L [Trichoplax sp. H2]|nr:Serine/threonine-protein kinase PDIK1L [Trichoplax sp. H2]|eukprot:RDD47269.1 Serine/threonine-protein kinase PDIK1L [Trichoplax sp. H2]